LVKREIFVAERRSAPKTQVVGFSRGEYDKKHGVDGEQRAPWAIFL